MSSEPVEAGVAKFLRLATVRQWLLHWHFVLCVRLIKAHFVLEPCLKSSQLQEAESGSCPWREAEPLSCWLTPGACRPFESWCPGACPHLIEHMLGIVGKMTTVPCPLTSRLYIIFHSPDKILGRCSLPTPEPVFLTSLRKLRDSWWRSPWASSVGL